MRLPVFPLLLVPHSTQSHRQGATRRPCSLRRPTESRSSPLQREAPGDWRRGEHRLCGTGGRKLAHGIFRIHHSTDSRTDTASHAGRSIFPFLWRLVRCWLSGSGNTCTSPSSDHTSCTNSPCNSAFHTSCPVSHEHHRSTENPATYLLAVIGIKAEHTH